MKYFIDNFGERKRKVRGDLFISLVFLIIVMPSDFLRAQSSNQNTGYLLQRVEDRNFFCIPFKHKLALPFFYGYYVVDESVLCSFFDSDSVDHNRVTMLCDPASGMFADSIITKEVMQSTRLKDILMLDDSEIYIIGGAKYVIRKIRYSYYDNTQVKVYIKGPYHFMWDDMSEEDTAIFYATYEVGQLYERDYYQCYHHLIELLPTSPQISKHLWKRLYQLGEDLNKK